MNDIFPDEFDDFDDDSSVDDNKKEDEGWSQCSDFDDDINFDNYRGE